MPVDRRSIPSDPGARVLLPIAALVVVALGLLAGALWFGSTSQDQLAREHERELVDYAIASLSRQVRITAQDYTHWDAAVRNLWLELDPEWADANVGPYIYENFGFEYSFVVDGDDRTTYGQIDGERVAADAFGQLSMGLDVLIAQARAEIGDADEPPTPAVGLLLADDQVVVAAVSPLKPEPGSQLRPSPGPPPVLVYAKRLDADFLGELEAQFRLRDVRMVQGPAATASEAVRLISPTGTELAALAWTPNEPGRQLLVWLTPVLLGALLIFLGFASLALHNIRAAAAAIRDGETRFRDIAEASSDWIWETDAELRVDFVSERFTELTGVRSDSVIGRRLLELLHPAEDLKQWERRLADIDARRPFRDALCHLDNDTDRNRTLRVAGKPVFSCRGDFQGYRGTASDITAELAAEARAHHLARHDPVSGLPNRLLLQERLGQAVAECRRQESMAAVLCLDLDRFKEINDGLGHAAGDLLIKACAERLSGCLRETDVLARLGGDEFAILQERAENVADVQALGDRLLASLNRPFHLDGHEVVVTASIGVAMIPIDGEDPDRLLQSADIALYRAKTEGRNRFRFFERGMDAELGRRKALEVELRHALYSGELELHYQPQIDLRTGALTALEALVRWVHPERGMISASAFIKIAEETGLIVAIGDWVLRTACAQAAGWPGVRLSINLSPVQFGHDDLVATVRAALERSGLEASRLELEITEAVLLHDLAGSLITLMRLKELGVRIVLDDFGTGDSSLGYLRRFPFDKIKIDQSFVQDLDREAESAAIVRAVVALGKNLGTLTCAEGVERSDQLALLRDQGCDQAQGFLFSRPLPAADVEAFIGRTGGRAEAAELVVDSQRRPA